MNYQSHSEQETKKIAHDFAPSLEAGTILCLHGDLGAGKTTFVKGLAEGLGITDAITSPTFTLMNIYNIKYPISNIQYLVHIDTYRLKDEHELSGIGVLDYIGQPNTITVIEWPEKVTNLLKEKKAINITFEHKNKTTRAITTNASQS